ncbi:MAG: inositol 2-dehydrogenase [Myxococcota bacterium]|jgi:myo-inositol 2-dehydrogenase/D-chiro-inositol 1-dehydrogenase|nr:inositol 2-dehydrogenase [Myxococcota bacterium]
MKLGVIGAGRIGQLHAETLALRVPGAQLVGVADIHRTAAQTLAERHGAAVMEAEALLASVDAVVIASSTDSHATFIEAAAAAGRHIFCEKPVDLSLERIDQALQAVAEAGVTLQVGFNRRFDPNFAHVQQQVRQGGVGDVHLVRITSRDPGPPPLDYVRVSGGLFLDMTIHDFDMARFLAGEVTHVQATGAVRVDPAIGEAGDIDTAVVVLEHTSGAITTIDNSRKAIYGYDQRVEVFGSGGMVWAENNSAHRTGLADGAGLHAPRPLDFFMDRYTESYVRELTAFVQCVRDGSEPPVTGADGRAPVVIGLAAQRSMAEGRRVAIPW